MDNQTQEYYKNNATQLYERYQKCEGGISKYFSVFDKGSKVLDFGAGSGRDLSILLDLGLDAYGYEPCDEFRNIAISNNPIMAGRLLKNITKKDNGAYKFEGILCSAVLMHIPDDKLSLTIKEISSLLKINGKLLISIPLVRNDIDKELQRDKDGRLFILRSSEIYIDMFKKYNICLINEFKNIDGLGRIDCSWSNLLFEGPG